MSRRNSSRIQKRTMKPNAQAQTHDSFQNFMARTGIGTDNMSTGSSYGFNPISRDRVRLEWMYRGSWLVGKAVDVVAEDMTREGVDINGDISPDHIEEFHVALHNLQLWQNLNDTIKWARLYGGAVAIMLIEGQDVSTPLRRDTITKGSFKGLLVLDRWMVQPSLNQPVTEYGPYLGQPEFYTVNQNAPALINKKVHYSRVIRIEGYELPFQQKLTENGWGISVVERLYDRLVGFDSATQGAAQLVYKAHLRTVKVKDLRKIIAAGGPALEGLVKQVDMIRKYQSNEGLTLLDGDDEFQADSYTFSGLDAVLLQFGQQLSGAIDIPLVRLFGQSPAGMNATGESDLRNYYDSVKAQQERRLKLPLTILFDVMHRSLFGEEPAKNFSFKFNPLWQMSEKEKAEVAESVERSTSSAYAEGLIGKGTALKTLRQSSEVTGIFSAIPDEEIKAAEEEDANPPVPDLEGLTGQDEPEDESVSEVKPEPKPLAAIVGGKT